MDPSSKQDVLHIRKYPNRRYYDATRSRHVTLRDVYDLVRSGHDVCITDSRNGEDITNLVLLQVVLEKDQPKLDLFPSSLVHLFIRSSRDTLHSSIERFFGPFMQLMSLSQQQFDSYVRGATRGGLGSPMDWAAGVMSSFASGSGSPPGDPVQEPPTDDDGEEAASDSPPSEAATDAASPEDSTETAIDDLRRQMDELTRRIEALGSDGRHGRGVP